VQNFVGVNNSKLAIAKFRCPQDNPSSSHPLVNRMRLVQKVKGCLKKSAVTQLLAHSACCRCSRTRLKLEVASLLWKKNERRSTPIVTRGSPRSCPAGRWTWLSLLW